MYITVKSNIARGRGRPTASSTRSSHPAPTTAAIDGTRVRDTAQRDSSPRACESRRRRPQDGRAEPIAHRHSGPAPLSLRQRTTIASRKAAGCSTACTPPSPRSKAPRVARRASGDPWQLQATAPRAPPHPPHSQRGIHSWVYVWRQGIARRQRNMPTALAL